MWGGGGGGGEEDNYYYYYYYSQINRLVQEWYIINMEIYDQRLMPTSVCLKQK